MTSQRQSDFGSMVLTTTWIDSTAVMSIVPLAHILLRAYRIHKYSEQEVKLVELPCKNQVALWFVLVM